MECVPTYTFSLYGKHSARLLWCEECKKAMYRVAAFQDWIALSEFCSAKNNMELKVDNRVFMRKSEWCYKDMDVIMTISLYLHYETISREHIDDCILMLLHK